MHAEQNLMRESRPIDVLVPISLTLQQGERSIEEGNTHADGDRKPVKPGLAGKAANRESGLFSPSPERRSTKTALKSQPVVLLRGYSCCSPGLYLHVLLVFLILPGFVPVSSTNIAASSFCFNDIIQHFLALRGRLAPAAHATCGRSMALARKASITFVRLSSMTAPPKFPYPAKVYKPLGRCVYCAPTANTPIDELSKEHIIPSAFGGELILPKASCKLHQKETSRVRTSSFAGICARSDRTFVAIAHPASRTGWI